MLANYHNENMEISRNLEHIVTNDVEDLSEKIVETLLFSYQVMDQGVNKLGGVIGKFRES